MRPLPFTRHLAATVAVLAAVMMIAGTATPAGAAGKITVFAAASTTDALTEVGAAFAKETAIEMVPSFASSSTLAKQIEEGAPADLFISANEKWMDHLADKALIVADSRADLLGNDLVLIAPADSPLDTVTIAPGLDLATQLDGGRLSVGDPDHVPAGQYARAALEHLGLWASVEPALARQNDVRSALALVERGETPLGIVYSTDAAASKGVKTVGVFPKDSHPPITYPVALVKDSDAGRKFVAYLSSDTAKAIFSRHGFTVN